MYDFQYILDMLDCMNGPGSMEAIANMGWQAWFELCDLSVGNPIRPQ